MKNRYIKSPQSPSSSSQYQEQINDKLNDLWSSMKRKKNQIIRSIAPSYSRKYDSIDQHSQSNLNLSKHQKSEISREKEKEREKQRAYFEEIETEYKQRLEVSERQIVKLRSRLTVEISHNKLKDTEIQELKVRMGELLSERQSFQIQKDRERQRDRSRNGETKKLQTTKINIDQRLSRRQQRQKENYHSNIINQSSIIQPIPEFEKSYISGAKGDTERLLQLLRSTEQYKEFVFYHDNNELSFLRNLGRMRRRNCACNLSEREKTLWAPKDVLEILKALNLKDEMNLDEEMMERIVYNLNLLYLHREKVRIEDLKDVYEKKISLIERKANASIPYDILQIQKQKERELMKGRGRSKSSVRK